MGLRHGIQFTAAQMDIPERTVYEWFEKSGGVAHLRNLADESRELAVANAAGAVAVEVHRKAEAGEIPADELMETYRTMIGQAGSNTPEATAAAQANAQVLQVIVQGEEGPEAIEVPRDNGAHTD